MKVIVSIIKYYCIQWTRERERESSFSPIGYKTYQSGFGGAIVATAVSDRREMME